MWVEVITRSFNQAIPIGGVTLVGTKKFRFPGMFQFDVAWDGHGVVQRWRSGAVKWS